MGLFGFQRTIQDALRSIICINFFHIIFIIILRHYFHVTVLTFALMLQTKSWAKLLTLGIVAQQVKLTFLAPACIVDCQFKSWLFCFRSSFLIMYLRRQQKMVQEPRSQPSTRITAGSPWLLALFWPKPAVVAFWGMNQQVENLSLCLFFCLFTLPFK